MNVTNLSLVQNDAATSTEDQTNINSWGVSVVVSEWYDDLFENWLYWFHKLSTNMMLILIAEDEFIYQKYSNSSLMEVISLNMNIVSFILSQY